MVLGSVSAVQSRRGDRLSSAKRNMHSVLDNTTLASGWHARLGKYIKQE